jgi:hypothetical protein
MEEKAINEKESLEIISKMIANTREKVKKNAGMPFLTWGYTTVIVSLAIWFLLYKTGDYHWHFLWFSIVAIGWPLSIISRNKKRSGVTTYIDRVVGKIWLVFAIGVILCSMMAFFVLKMPILFLVLLLISMAVTLTGFVIKFNIAVGFGIFGVLASFLFLFISGTTQILLFAAVFFVMMVVPGHILNYLTKKENV